MAASPYSCNITNFIAIAIIKDVKISGLSDFMDFVENKKSTSAMKTVMAASAYSCNFTKFIYLDVSSNARVIQEQTLYNSPTLAAKAASPYNFWKDFLDLGQKTRIHTNNKSYDRSLALQLQSYKFYCFGSTYTNIGTIQGS